MIGAITAGLFGAGAAAASNSYESIATAVGTGSSGVITLSSIPSTYKHLQLRVYIGASNSFATIRLNGDTTAANYRAHYLVGDGSAASSGTFASNAYFPVTAISGAYAGVLDILDYQNTNKYKTVRSLEGTDNNSSGSVYMTSDLWMSTAAISSIVLTCNSGNFPTASSFALYGIKG